MRSCAAIFLGLYALPTLAR